MNEHRTIATGVLGCALVLNVFVYAGAADESAVPQWTEDQTAKGYVVFAHSTLARLGADYVPTRVAIVDKLSCTLAGNEFESLQLGVHAIGGDLNDITLEVETDIPVKVYHGGNAEVDARGFRKQPDRSTGVVWEPPDVVLHHGGTVGNVAAGKSINYWLTFHAPAETRAGPHISKIRIKPADKQATELNLEVHVRPFVLHRPRISIGIYYPQGLGDDQKWTATFKDMAEHGQTAIALYDYTSWMQVKKGKQGTLRYLRLAKSAGLAHADIPWVWLFGGGFDYMEDGKKAKGNQQSRIEAVTWLGAENRKQGWPEMVYYGSDEPIYPLPWLRPHFLPWRQVPMRLTTAMSAYAAYGHGDLHDVWIVHCPVITPHMRAEAGRMGAQLWMYSAAIRSWEPLRERYLTGIFTWSNKLLGSYLWAGPSYEQHWWPHGGSEPLPMTGWEMRREGVDDYRYFQMLEDCIATRPNEMLGVEAAGWLEAVRQRYTMNPHKVEPGTPLLLDEYDTIRAKAADYIERLGAVSEEGLKPPPVTSVKDEAKPFRDKSIDECISGLSSADVWQRRSAAWALFERGAEAATATKSLAGLLDDDDVRMVTLHALEAIGPDAYTAIPDIAAQLAHNDAFVRIGATYVLGAIGAYPREAPRMNPHELPPPAPTPAAKAVAEPLRTLLHDENPMVVQIAARALGRLGPAAESALPEAIAMLDDPHNQGSAVTLIAAMGSTAVQAVPKLIEQIETKDGAAPGQYTALGAIGPEAHEAVPVIEKWLATNPGYSERDRMLFALFYIRGENRDLDNLVTMMRDNELPDWKMKHLAIGFDALGSAAAPVVDEVRELMQSKYPKLHESQLMDSYYDKVAKGEGPRRMLP